MWPRRRADSSGLTLLEVVVVLAIIGILLALAVPRYLANRRLAYVVEANNALAEIKTLAWAYYMRRDTWLGVASTAALGFEPASADSRCWNYVLTTATAAEIRFEAQGRNTPVKCLPAFGTTVTLVLRSDGSADRSAVFP